MAISIGASIANKLREQLEKEEKLSSKNTTTSASEPKEEELKTITKQSNEFPEKFGLNLESTDPAGELAKIDEYYKLEREKQKEAEKAEPVKLDRVDVPSVSDEDLLVSAKQSVDAKYNTKRNQTLEEFDNLVSSLEAKKETSKKNQQENETKINSYFDEADQSVQNNVLKRGLARSSIAVLELDGLTKERANALSKTATDLSDELAKLDDEILALEAKKENALISLDLDWATELNKEIADREEALRKKQKEAIEFNNNVTKLESELNLKKEKQDNDILMKNIENGIINENYNANSSSSKGEEVLYKINYITNYLNKLSKAEALKKLTTDNMIAYYLGDAFSGVYYTQAQRKN